MGNKIRNMIHLELQQEVSNLSDMYNRIKPEMISIIPIKIAVINGGFLKKGLFSFPVTCSVCFFILNFNSSLNFSLILPYDDLFGARFSFGSHT